MSSEIHQFSADEAQVLDLMIHSLYSNKEIFLRELVSNASDALDKLRLEGLQNPDIYEGEPEAKIKIVCDPEQRTVSIIDNGIGMDKADMIEHLGTIARSGTQKVKAAMTKEQAKDSSMIGQFGVGFYSSFIVADRVEVRSRKAGQTAGFLWASEGTSEYTLDSVDKPSRGTEITLYLKSDDAEFSQASRLRHIVSKYSDHISYPIVMDKMPMPEFDDDGNEVVPETAPVPEEEVINQATALWTLPRSDISDEQYQGLYKHISHDFNEPLVWSHNKVEGKYEYTSLLFIPKQAPFDMWNPQKSRGLKLYVNRVFIMDDAEQFLPSYLRFVKGIIDCADLPLNVSREILQSNKIVDTIRQAVIKRVIQMIADMAKNDLEKFNQFYSAFGQVLKEGVVEDYTNRDALAGLLRFNSTAEDSDTPSVSLDDYVARMAANQDKIYYIAADNYLAAKHSPHLEAFKSRGTEVLLMYDRIDEWMVTHYGAYQEKTFQSVAKGAWDEDLDEASKDALKALTESHQGTLETMKTLLEDKVKDVRFSKRLVNSPACIVADDNDMTQQMAKIMQATGQQVPFKPIFELNPEHPLVRMVLNETNDKKAKDWMGILYDQAILSEGGQLDDPAQFVNKLNDLILEKVPE